MRTRIDKLKENEKHDSTEDSHAYYYKILDETRKHSIPVRYFSYASALKCAEQLAEQDMKEAQK